MYSNAGGQTWAAGTNATTVTPGPWHIARMLQALDDVPMNIGLLGKGHAGTTEPIAEQAAVEQLRERIGTQPEDGARTVGDMRKVCDHGGQVLLVAPGRRRWREGRREVMSEATEGVVHEECAMPVSKTTASFANFRSSGVVFRL